MGFCYCRNCCARALQWDISWVICEAIYKAIGQNMNILLDENKKETPEFDFVGDCYICAKGSGQITLQRKMGDSFENITNERGEELTYIGEGVIFNGSINCKKRIPHKIVGSTNSGIVVSIVAER